MDTKCCGHPVDVQSLSEESRGIVPDVVGRGWCDGLAGGYGGPAPCPPLMRRDGLERRFRRAAGWLASRAGRDAFTALPFGCDRGTLATTMWLHRVFRCTIPYGWSQYRADMVRAADSRTCLLRGYDACPEEGWVMAADLGHSGATRVDRLGTGSISKLLKRDIIFRINFLS